MNLAHLLQRQALEHPDRPALFNGTQPVASHAQWAQRAARVGARLRAAGVVVREVIETRTSLEEVFMSAIRATKGGES